MYWPSNFEAVSTLIDESRSHDSPAWLATVRGTVHISQSDFSILYPHVCSVLLKTTADPLRALDLNISASLEFLARVMGEQGGGKTILERCMADEGLLDTEETADLPEERRPADKWIAARLRIPHEFHRRVAYWFGGKEKMMRKRRGDGEEIWMHVKTSREEVDKWRGSGLKQREGREVEDNGRDEEKEEDSDEVAT
jgi:platelet-activating factor acetylhydrolase